MSYHRKSQMLPLADLPAGPQYPLVPFGQAAPVPAQQGNTTRMLLIAIGVILLIAVVAWLMQSASKPKMTRNQAARKMSTPELAKALYERLESRGRVNPTVMRSLESYARRK